MIDLERDDKYCNDDFEGLSVQDKFIKVCEDRGLRKFEYNMSEGILECWEGNVRG